MMRKNTLVYMESFIINFKNTLLTKCASDSDILFIPPLATNKKIIKSIFSILTFPNRIKPITVNKCLFWLFFLALPIFLFKYKMIPSEAFLILFIVISQLIVYSWLSPAHPRFRYNIDPLIYFVQIYPAVLFVRNSTTFFVKIFCKNNKNNKL